MKTTRGEQPPPLRSCLSQVKNLTFLPRGTGKNGGVLECEPERTAGLKADGTMPCGFPALETKGPLRVQRPPLCSHWWLNVSGKGQIFIDLM